MSSVKSLADTNNFLSLIDMFFVTVSSFCGIGTKRSLHHQVNFASEQFLQVHQHTSMREERKGLAGVIGDKKDVHVALWCFFSSGEGTEKPCFQDGLRLEIVGNGFLHCHDINLFSLCFHWTRHQYLLMISAAKIRRN